MALLVTFVFANIVKWAVVDPLATVAMIVSYNRAVAGQEPAHDLRATLANVSGKFRQLAQKAAAPPPAAALLKKSSLCPTDTRSDGW